MPMGFIVAVLVMVAAAGTLAGRLALACWSRCCSSGIPALDTSLVIFSRRRRGRVGAHGAGPRSPSTHRATQAAAERSRRRAACSGAVQAALVRRGRARRAGVKPRSSSSGASAYLLVGGRRDRRAPNTQQLEEFRPSTAGRAGGRRPGRGRASAPPHLPDRARPWARASAPSFFAFYDSLGVGADRPRRHARLCESLSSSARRGPAAPAGAVPSPGLLGPRGLVADLGDHGRNRSRARW